jgi:hypothetical protein
MNHEISGLRSEALLAEVRGGTGVPPVNHAQDALVNHAQDAPVNHAQDAPVNHARDAPVITRKMRR